MGSLIYTDNSLTGQFPGEITDRGIIHQMGRSHKNTYNALEGQSLELHIYYSDYNGDDTENDTYTQCFS